MAFENKEGQRVPNCSFPVRVGDSWATLTTDEIFNGKTVVVFSLPGAFTPTCSSTHLPRYNELAAQFKARGVDEIVCVSVNDTFVMNEWKKQQEAENIAVLPDGNTDFTKGMGMLVAKNNLGFGDRSWRYSMLVKDGVVAKMFIEPEKDGDPFEVSDADTMIRFIDPEFQDQPSISLFTKPGCQYCAKAKEVLAEQGLAYEEIVLGSDASTVSLRAITGKTSAPQVFIGGEYIGGSEELEAYFANATA